jgi:SM-20-related protein
MPAIIMDRTATASSTQLDLTPLRAAPRQQEPYPWIVATGCLRSEAIPALTRDFPMLSRPGYHPVAQFTSQGAFAALLAEIEAGALDGVIGEKLGFEATALPRLITVQRTSPARAGRPHTDSERKVATLLIYLNNGWTSPEDHIRVLRREALEDPVAELPPAAGNIFAFLRTDQSWHGHTPFTGEQRVIQVAWLRDAAALKQKQRRHRLGWLLKGLGLFN